jgi:prolyl-tRNA editing enzyme YbaK/EbsC (Cys-tRNA(Pro) deacylase)
MTTATLVRPERQATRRFELWLAEHGVPYEVAEGGPSTPWNADDEPPLAKTITVIDDQANPHLLVLDAGTCLDLDAAARALSCRWLTMLAGPDRPKRVMGRQLEPLPPVPELCGFPVHADEALRSSLTLTLHGTAGRLLTFSRAVWESQAGIRYFRLATNCSDSTEPIEWY